MIHAYPDARRHFDRRIAEALEQLADDPRNLEAQRRLALAKRDHAQLVAAIDARKWKWLRWTVRPLTTVCGRIRQRGSVT